jgi:hypothetical protein
VTNVDPKKLLVRLKAFNLELKSENWKSLERKPYPQGEHLISWQELNKHH